MMDFTTLPRRQAGCRMPTSRSIAYADRTRREDGERGSARLLLALYAYGRKHGLPNITRRQCQDRFALVAGRVAL